MKRLLTMMASAAATFNSIAAIPVVGYSEVTPVDMVSMDMATDEALRSMKNGGEPSGVVIVIAGQPRGVATDIENAMTKSKLTSLAGADVYSVNRPTTAEYLYLVSHGVDMVYFVNDAEQLTAAGLRKAADYDDKDVADPKLTLRRVDFPQAQRLLKK